MACYQNFSEALSKVDKKSYLRFKVALKGSRRASISFCAFLHAFRSFVETSMGLASVRLPEARNLWRCLLRLLSKSAFCRNSGSRSWEKTKNMKLIIKWQSIIQKETQKKLQDISSTRFFIRKKFIRKEAQIVKILRKLSIFIGQ